MSSTRTPCTAPWIPACRASWARLPRFCSLRSRFLRLRVAGDVDVGVYVRSAAEVPDEGWPFQPPDVPDLVGADVVVLVESNVHLVEAAARLEAAHRFLHILLAVGREQLVHDLLDQLLLVVRELGNGDTGELRLGAANLHGVFPRRLVEQGL